MNPKREAGGASLVFLVRSFGDAEALWKSLRDTLHPKFPWLRSSGWWWRGVLPGGVEVEVTYHAPTEAVL